jgi:hypothetical protein
MKDLAFKSIYIILLILSGCGVWLIFDPYLFATTEKIESITVWNNGEDVNALILFTFSSKGFISTNYPVEVTVDIKLFNESLILHLNQKKYIELDIAGTYSYPIKTGPLGIYQGSIPLHFSESNKLQGKGKVIFPHQGNTYYFSILAYNSGEEFSPPIYTMNVSDIGKSIPPVFNIEESYASRAQFETSNRQFGLAIVTLAVSGIGIIVNIRQKKHNVPNKRPKSTR